MKPALAWILLFILQIWASRHWIAMLEALRVVQIQKSYGLQSHIQTKSTTPSMGGVVFLFIGLSSIIPVALFSDTSLLQAASFWILPLGAAGIGFIDDWLKYARKSSEGFPSLYKLTAQILLTVPWAFWVAVSHGLFLWPGVEIPVSIQSLCLFCFQ